MITPLMMIGSGIHTPVEGGAGGGGRMTAWVSTRANVGGRQRGLGEDASHACIQAQAVLDDEAQRGEHAETGDHRDTGDGPDP